MNSYFCSYIPDAWNTLPLPHLSLSKSDSFPETYYKYSFLCEDLHALTPCDGVNEVSPISLRHFNTVTSWKPVFVIFLLAKSEDLAVLLTLLFLG